MNHLKGRYHATYERIKQACIAHGRAVSEVSLLAVSKTRPADDIRELAQYGQKAFGENYVQEYSSKQISCADLDLEWHFIGPIQSNKTRDVAASCHWVHSIDRLKIAQRLQAQRPDEQAPLNILIQINIDEEDSKSGIPPSEIAPLLSELATLDRLICRGFMCIPTAKQNPSASFAKMRAIFEQYAREYPTIDTLSMGMSNDLDIAIAHGSTMVRIGTDIFGARTPTTKELT